MGGGQRDRKELLEIENDCEMDQSERDERRQKDQSRKVVDVVKIMAANDDPSALFLFLSLQVSS